MRKIQAIVAAIVLIIGLTAILISLDSKDPLSPPPVSGAAIGVGWNLDSTQEVEDGTKWTYTNKDASLDIRIRKFKTANYAAYLYADTVLSKEIKLKKLVTINNNENATVGIYYGGAGKGPWLVLLAQNGQRYLDIAYANDFSGTSYDGDFDADVEWIAGIADTIF